MNMIEKTLQQALQTATAKHKLAPMVSDEAVARCIERLGREGYIPSPQIVEPIRAYLSGYGILLSGPAGVGKTLLMQHLRQRIISTTKIIGYGLKEIGVWYDSWDTYEACIDDLGAEFVVSEYGAKEDLMKLVIAHRCERINSRTCFTTNLTAEEIAARYGDRTLSRLFSMCKPFSLDGVSMRTPEPVASPNFWSQNQRSLAAGLKMNVVRERNLLSERSSVTFTPILPQRCPGNTHQ